MGVIVFLLLFIGSWVGLSRWARLRGQNRWLALLWTGAVAFLVGTFGGAWTDGAFAPAPAIKATTVAETSAIAPSVAEPATPVAKALTVHRSEPSPDGTLADRVRANATPCEKVLNRVKAFRRNIGDAVCILNAHGETLRLALRSGSLRTDPNMVDIFAMATASILSDGSEARLWPDDVDLKFAMQAVRADADGHPDARPDGSLRMLSVMELTFPATERSKLGDVGLSPSDALDVGHPRIVEKEIIPTLMAYCDGSSGRRSPGFCKRVDSEIDAG